MSSIFLEPCEPQSLAVGISIAVGLGIAVNLGVAVGEYRGKTTDYRLSQPVAHG